MATSRICSVPNCGKSAGRTRSTKGLRYLLDVALPYEGDECLIWPFGRDVDGYGKIYWNSKHKLVHRVICEETNGPPPTPEHQSAHSCGKGHLGCITKRHLSWKTPIGNQADRIAHGTTYSGPRPSRARLTEMNVREIRTLKDTMPRTMLAAMFGVSRTQIGNIISGKSWNIE